MPLNKSYSAILFFLILGVYVLKVPCVYIEFKLNQSYIVENKCNNADNPIMMCGGMCYLREQLKEIDESENPEETPIKIKFDDNEFYFIVSLSVESREFQIRNNHYGCVSNNYTSLKWVDIFHPPVSV